MNSPRIGSLEQPPVIGSKYIVPYVKVRSEYEVPVIGNVHRDPVLGPIAKCPHIHVDIRFSNDDIIRYLFFSTIEKCYPDLEKGGPFRVYVVSAEDTDYKIYEKEMECLRNPPHLPFKSVSDKGYSIFWHSADSLDQVAKLEDLVEKRRVKSCKTCPHHGTPLGSTPVIDGVRTCPAHFLDWSEKTGRLVRRTRWKDAKADHATDEYRKEVVG